MRLLVALLISIGLQAQVIRVNVGGPQYTDTSGAIWDADYGFNGGSTFSTAITVTGTSDPTLYKTGRTDTSSFSYAFDVADGIYLVNLKFAEVQGATTRNFGVILQGLTVLSNFNVAALAGQNAAYDRQLLTKVLGNSPLTIIFSQISGAPIVQAIEVIYLYNVAEGNTANPDHCTQGNLFYRTDLLTYYGCFTTDTWTAITSGGGSITAVNGTTPISASTVAGTTTVSCPTCVTAASALTSNRIVLGAGSQAAAVLGSLGTTSTVLHGNAGGAPTFGSIASSDLNITATTCTNQFISAISSSGVGTCSTPTAPHVFTCQMGSATGTTVLSTGDAGCYASSGAYSGTINRIDTIGNAASLATCSITVDIWKRNAVLPTVSQKISASAPGTLSSATVAQSGSLSGWTTSVSANDIWNANIASVTGCVFAKVTVYFQ